MALASTTLTLDAATLSGGARIATASGNLPRRVTTAADVLIDAVCGGFSVPSWNSNNEVWVSDFVNSVRRYSSSGSLLQTIATTNAMASAVVGSTLLTGKYNAGPLAAYNALTGAALWSDAGVTNIRQIAGIPGGTTFWVIPFSSGSATEYRLDGTGATGRTIATTAQAMAADSVGLWLTDGNTPRHYLHSNLTNDATISSHANGVAYPGYWGAGAIFGLACDGSDRLCVMPLSGSGIDRFASAASGAAFDRRVRSAGYYGESNANQNGLGFSPDGTLVAFVAPNAANTNAINCLRIVLTGIQRARWSWTPGKAVTLNQVCLPGGLGLDYDTGVDYRRTRCYYSLNGGSTRTEIVPGTPLSVAVSAVQTLTLDADLRVWEVLSGIPPYVGGSDGSGPTLVYDDGIASGGAPLIGAGLIRGGAL